MKKQVEKFHYIRLPLLKPIMLYTLVTSAIGGLQMYDIPALFNVPETGLVGLPDDKTIATYGCDVLCVCITAMLERQQPFP